MGNNRKSHKLNNPDGNLEEDKALYEIIEAIYLEVGRANQRINDIHSSLLSDLKEGLAKEIKSTKESIPDENLIVKEIKNVRMQLQDASKLKEAIQDKEMELERLREEIKILNEEKEHLNSLLSYRDEENIKLNQEVEMFKRWIKKLNENIPILFKSKGWRIGNLIVKTVKKLAFRKHSNKRLIEIKRVLKEYQGWQSNQ